MIKNKWKIIGILAVIFFLVVIYLGLSNNKLRMCPDAWYDNRMPGSNGGEYLVIGDKRAELKDYDMEWIKENCGVKEPQPVY